MLRTLAIALLAALPATAFTIPADLEDGVYAAWHDETGAEVHHLISPITLATRTIEEREPQASTTLTPGGSGGTTLSPGGGSSSGSGSGSGTTLGGGSSSGGGYTPFILFCNCTQHLPSHNTDVAVANLEAALGTNTFIPATVGYFSIASNVVAFACNQNSVPFSANSDYYAFATAEITHSCGGYVAGNFLLSGLDAGYMGYKTGVNFCVQAEQLGDQSC
jgi:hypothetical protein